jgi:8-oxo-dGTP pyrophosphatase MutT (NUDIX family)
MTYNDNRVQHCTNCGLHGHIFRNCQSPVTSYGVIAVRYVNNLTNMFSKSNITNFNDSIEYLLIQRKDSLSFVEFVRGKYNVEEDDYIGRLLRGMTYGEQELVRTKTFDELWKGIWGESSGVRSHKTDYDNSQKKFELISEKLHRLLDENPTKWTEPEWGFPKGRRNPHESDIVCAIREFQEETALRRQDIIIIQNTLPISETFFGSNQVHYCHKYYIAYCHKDVEANMNMNNPHMAREIGAIKWCSLDDALIRIRPDNVEKREILLKAGKILRNFYPIETHDMSRAIYKTR